MQWLWPTMSVKRTEAEATSWEVMASELCVMGMAWELRLVFKVPLSEKVSGQGGDLFMNLCAEVHAMRWHTVDFA
jgi:hypothetical protein